MRHQLHNLPIYATFQQGRKANISLLELRKGLSVRGDTERAVRPPRVPNSPTGQVLEARPDFSIQVDVNDWT